MTIASISLLCALSCCLFFGGKCARTLKSHETEPRRHAHADVGGCALQLFVFGSRREHADERVATVLVGHGRPTTGMTMLAHGGRRSLESALLRIAARWQLSGVNAADYKVLHIIEGVAHELAHALDLGSDFEISIHAMEAAKANEREAAALRIEVAALGALGVRLSTRRLWASANWCDIRIPFIQLALPLNRHEQSCVKRFVAMVKHEVMKAQQARLDIAAKKTRRLPPAAAATS